MEVIIGKLISVATGISFDTPDPELWRSFKTNFISNLATAGLGNKTSAAIALRNLIDFGIRMVSDVAFGGQDLLWAASINLISLGASGLLLRNYGEKILGECIGRFGGCFVPGTPVVIEQSCSEKNPNSYSTPQVQSLVKTTTSSIELVPLGARVLTDLPEILSRDSLFGEPQQATWKRIHISQFRRDGLEIDMELIRPQWWIDLTHLKEGVHFEFDIPELESTGVARVNSITECPTIEDGEGEVVIGKFLTRQVSNLFKVTLEDGNSFVGTGSHRVWQSGLHCWRRIDDLLPGDKLLSLTNDTTITSVNAIDVKSDVFNIEVNCEHAYRITENGFLVHNMNYAGLAPAGRSIWTSRGALTGIENAFAHWKKHLKEFPELQNALEYVRKAMNFVTSPPSGTLTKVRSNGDKLFYHPSTNTFVSQRADGAMRTMFRPKDQMAYWNAQ